MADEVELWYANAHFRLGEAYRTRGRWQKARSEYEKAVRISPHFCQALNALAETFLAEGKADRAMELLQRAAVMHDDDPVVHLNLGRAFLCSGRHADAAAEFALALKNDPDNPEVNLFIGKMSLEKREYQQAISHLQKAVSAKKLRLDAQLCIGVAQLGLGTFEEATKTLKDVLREDPSNVSALNCISIAYRRRGMEYEAMKYFRRARATSSRPGSCRIADCASPPPGRELAFRHHHRRKEKAIWQLPPEVPEERLPRELRLQPLLPRSRAS